MVDSAEHRILAGEVRTRALTYLVGQSRAYLQQLEGAREELAELREPDIDPVLKAVERAIKVVSAVNSIGSHMLRERDG
jgi:hypothetical protein